MDIFLPGQYPQLKIGSLEQEGPQMFKKKEGGPDPLLQASQEFESIFLYYMFKAMRSTVPEGGLIPRTMGQEIFEGMLDEEVARQASQNEDYGLARLLYDQLSRINLEPGE